MGAHRRPSGRPAGPDPGRRPGDLRGPRRVDAGVRAVGLQRPAGAGDVGLGMGQAILTADYPAAVADPTSVLFRPPASIWDRPQLLATAGQELSRSGVFSSVVGALDPSGQPVSATELAEAHAQLAGLGAAAQLPTVAPAGVTLPMRLPRYQGSAQYISADGRTIQFQTSLRAGGPRARPPPPPSPPCAPPSPRWRTRSGRRPAVSTAMRRWPPMSDPSRRTTCSGSSRS